MKITFKYRLYPTKVQQKYIDEQLAEACFLYNCALEHRIRAYRTNGSRVTYYDQAAELKAIRIENLTALANFSCCQDILRRLDKTFKSFFARVKRGEKAGFPRFRSAKRFNTITYPSYGDGCKMKGKRVYLQGIGDIAIRLHRPINGVIKTVSLCRQNNKTYACFACEVSSHPLEKSALKIGIDVGIESFAFCSDGERIDNPRSYITALKKIKSLQRSVARKYKQSNSRKKVVQQLAKLHEKVANRRHDFLHKQSRIFVNRYGFICVEDLNIKGLSKGILSKSVHDVAWGMFFNFLSYKAESAGRNLIKVNPNGTSQRCNNCGSEAKKTLANRWHHCNVCGESVHRDHNSAKEILRLGTSLGTVTYSIGNSVVSEALLQ